MDDFDQISTQDVGAYDDMDINLERGSGQLPEGVHRFIITNIDMREGPSGDPYFNITMDVDGGDFEGSRVWATVSTGQKSRWKMDEFLDAVGADTHGRITPRQIIQKYTGARVLGEVFHDTYEGRTSPKVKRLLPVGDGKPIASGGVQQPLANLSATRREKKPKSEGIPDDVVE